ncbi:MAG: hypothetical protein EZS28_050274, partial [Streblomastix strix]
EIEKEKEKEKQRKEKEKEQLKAILQQRRQGKSLQKQEKDQNQIKGSINEKEKQSESANIVSETKSQDISSSSSHQQDKRIQSAVIIETPKYMLDLKPEIKTEFVRQMQKNGRDVGWNVSESIGVKKRESQKEAKPPGLESAKEVDGNIPLNIVFRVSMNKDNTSDVESSNTASQAYAGLEEADKAVKEADENLAILIEELKLVLEGIQIIIIFVLLK